MKFAYIGSKEFR